MSQHHTPGQQGYARERGHVMKTWRTTRSRAFFPTKQRHWTARERKRAPLVASHPSPAVLSVFSALPPTGMARLNTHLSATPQPTRASTADSLYRDPSVAPRHASHARLSSYSVLSPTHSESSDKENASPGSHANTPRLPKDRGLRGASARIPTPDSGSTPGASGNKRRRTDSYAMLGSDIYQDGPDDGDEAPEVQQEDEANPNLRFYNPNQNPEQRRQLRARMRDHQRMVEGEFGILALCSMPRTNRLRQPRRNHQAQWHAPERPQGPEQPLW